MSVALFLLFLPVAAVSMLFWGVCTIIPLDLAVLLVNTNLILWLWTKCSKDW